MVKLAELLLLIGTLLSIYLGFSESSRIGVFVTAGFCFIWGFLLLIAYGKTIRKEE